MGLLSLSKVEVDFAGGIYLEALGQVPSVERIERVDYRGDLYLPLSRTGGQAMRLIVREGQVVLLQLLILL